MSLRPRMPLAALRSVRAVSTMRAPSRPSSAPSASASASTSASTRNTSSGPSSSSSSSSSSSPPPDAPSRLRHLRWAALFAPLLIYEYFATSGGKPLSPQVYSEQRVSGLELLATKRHALLTVPVHTRDRAQFEGAAVPGAAGAAGLVVVQHVMVRNPALMIERPYTPINDVAADGEMAMVVKRVKGGEVGRLVHALAPGSTLGVRGPITTFALNPAAYDRIVMVSTGTAVAPFLQLLAKAPVGTTTYRLLQAKPAAGDDWSAEYIAPLQKRFGDKLEVQRIEPGLVRQADVVDALEGGERVLVLVCLPPNIMRPLCGTLTPTLEQGPLTGLLADMGLQRHQVYKLE